MQRRIISREYKLEAVKLAGERGLTVARAARDLDLHENGCANEFGSTATARTSPFLEKRTVGHLNSATGETRVDVLQTSNLRSSSGHLRIALWFSVRRKAAHFGRPTRFGGR